MKSKIYIGIAIFVAVCSGAAAVDAVHKEEARSAAMNFAAPASNVSDAVPTAPGSQAVYQKIDRMTSCGALQKVFDGALANAQAAPATSPTWHAQMGYADAANNRMQSVGCYG